MRILYVVGTRPNFVKTAPVIAAMRSRLPDGHHVIVHTGQHYDRAMSEVFFEELGVPAPDHMLEVGSGTHAQQTARTMERLEPVIESEKPDLLVVPGDVNSTLAAVLTAVKMGLPVAHVESGLRSFDLSMPEEVNRIVADRFGSHLFLHSEEAIGNLRAEGIGPERMHFVGNTMIDTLVALEDRIAAAGTAAKLDLSPGSYLLVTLHRPALVDGPLLAETVAQLSHLAQQMPVVFPVHPRTRKMMAALGIEAARGPDPDRAVRLPRLPLPAHRRHGGPDRLGRDPGGDDLPRRPLLHPARQHRAPGDGRARHQHPARPRPGGDRRNPGDTGEPPDRPPRATAPLGRPRRRADRRHPLPARPRTAQRLAGSASWRRS